MQLRRAASQAPWPVVLVYVLVVLPPLLTLNAERRYRVLPDDLALSLAFLEAIVTGIYVIAALRKIEWLTKALIIAFCAGGIIINAAGLLFLIGKMLDPSGLDGRRLLISAVYLWTSNVLIFSLAFWGMDGGGPSGRDAGDRPRDLIFPEMQNSDKPFFPAFVDYLYVAFSTSTAFSATDTVTASSRVRLLLMLQAAISLATLAIVAARAINIFPSG